MQMQKNHCKNPTNRISCAYKNADSPSGLVITGTSLRFIQEVEALELAAARKQLIKSLRHVAMLRLDGWGFRHRQDITVRLAVDERFPPGTDAKQVFIDGAFCLGPLGGNVFLFPLVFGEVIQGLPIDPQQLACFLIFPLDFLLDCSLVAAALDHDGVAWLVGRLDRLLGTTLPAGPSRSRAGSSGRARNAWGSRCWRVPRGARGSRLRLSTGAGVIMRSSSAHLLSHPAVGPQPVLDRVHGGSVAVHLGDAVEVQLDAELDSWTRQSEVGTYLDFVGRDQRRNESLGIERHGSEKGLQWSTGKRVSSCERMFENRDISRRWF